MPRGLPDYYNPDTLVSQRLANVEEVVTQLRGIASLDNRGRTLWFTNFKDGVSDFDGFVGGDATLPASSTDKAEVAPNSMKMAAGTVGGSGACYAQKIFRLMNVPKAGLEVGFCYDSDAPIVGVQLHYDNGVNNILGGIRVNHNANILQIREGFAWVNLISLDDPTAIHEWMIVKLVIDFENSVYSHLILGSIQYDISDRALDEAATTYAGRMIAQITGTPIDGGTDIAYIGHAALTIDEP